MENPVPRDRKVQKQFEACAHAFQLWSGCWFGFAVALLPDA